MEEKTYIPDCPTDNCDECGYQRMESWCSRALPQYNGPDEKHKIYMEGFWEALDWAEEHYKWLEEHYEKNNDYVALMAKLLDECYADGRSPTAEEIMKIDNYWND